MHLTTSPSRLSGSLRIPASKSHTVRAALFAALADGESVIRAPLDSGDTRSALVAAAGLGAAVRDEGEVWRIRGVAGEPRGGRRSIDVGNSGTTLYIALAAAALAREGETLFDGDAQIRRRSAANLLASLADLGADIEVRGDKAGCCPILVRPALRGGRTSIECPTSQYLTSLLIAAPLAPEATEIAVPLLFERPYVEMTLAWLASLGIRLEAAPDRTRFRIPGGQRYPAFDREMPGDFSSATFFLCAGALAGGDLLLEGLDLADEQGDKAVVDYLRAMGARIEAEPRGLRVRGGAELRGADLDLNATPDALPALAVTACFARGKTVLGNVPQARMKETDRIAVMARELSRLGGRVTERPDGLVIEGGGLDGGAVSGHDDHRVVMAFAVAGLVARGPITVDSAEAAAITFPGFAGLLARLGGSVREA